MTRQALKPRFSVSLRRPVFYARSGDIPLPRRDRLALLANHALRRAVSVEIHCILWGLILAGGVFMILLRY